MSLTGRVFIDLRDVPPDRAHRRVACLPTTPTGVRVVLLVGPLAVNPHVARLVHEHLYRLEIEVWGESYAVPRWLDALATGGVLPLEEAAS